MYRHCLLAGAGLVATFLPAQEPIRVTPAADDVPALAVVLDRLGAELAARGPRDGNFCHSPASIGLCLLLALPGARSGTATELQKLLCPEGWDDKRTLVAARLLVMHLRNTKTIELTVVHDLWPQVGQPLLQDYRTAVWAAFDSRVLPQDYVKDPAGARRTINEYVAKATKERIAELLPADAINTDTRLVLTNAIWLKADWKDQFKAADTHDGAFHLGNGSEATVPMMHRRGEHALAEVDGLQVLRIPYVDQEFAFEVALPARGTPLATAEAALRPDGMANWAKALKTQSVAVALPRFRVEGSFRLVEALRALGLVQATTANQADFSGIDGGAGRLYIGEVLHKTFLDVAEKGTEAAAATAVVMRAGSAMRPAAAFTADRPFAFALRDLTTGLILFAGRLCEPRAQKN
jgi:serpin B